MTIMMRRVKCKIRRPPKPFQAVGQPHLFDESFPPLLLHVLVGYTERILGCWKKLWPAQFEFQTLDSALHQFLWMLHFVLLLGWLSTYSLHLHQDVAQVMGKPDDLVALCLVGGEWGEPHVPGRVVRSFKGEGVSNGGAATLWGGSVREVSVDLCPLCKAVSLRRMLLLRTTKGNKLQNKLSTF